MNRINPQFIDEVRRAGPFNATACMNCGTCTALCPIGLEVLPREMFRYVLLGLEDKVLDHEETIFTCLLCKLCESNCPGGVHIVDNVRTLRHYINRMVHKL